MGFRRLAFLLSVTFALSLAACGDNQHPVFEDAMPDTTGNPDDDAAVDAPPDALTCDSPQVDCNGVCVNTTTDDSNCGACGTTCGTNETCSNGLCCGADQTNCNGTCVDTSDDVANCGACGTTCTGSQTCQNGTCCGDGTTVCGNQCFNLDTSNQHCGACNTMCDTGEACTDGKCCPTGWLNCGGTCVDPMSDEAHCGNCTTSCDAATQTCDTGVCCGNNEKNCGGTCTTVGDDENNCGACGVTCDTNQTCDSGKCCDGGTTNCGGTCRNLMDDELACGTCGTTCASGETCSNGLCCGPGTIRCGNACVNPLTDPTACGTCGTTCQGGTPVCSGGVCSDTCGPGEQSCSGACVDVNSDHGNCGGCGDSCAANEVCSGGTCTTTCTGSETMCGGSCVDTNTNPNYCGNCNTVCAPGDECVNGVCQLDCPSGEDLCGSNPGVCRNLLTDPNNCGTCGVTCGAGTCQNGMCCGPGLTRCGNQCVDLTSNNNFCGSCSTVCGMGTECDNGRCCGTNENNCGGQCSNPMTDDRNCGACGNDCTAAGGTCQLGMCCPAGEENVMGKCCPIGFLNCNGQCKNPLTDPLNCNACGNACGDGQFCDNGSCEAVCDPPRNSTCGVCTNTDTDPDFCGPSCRDCPSGSTCNNGSCTACPFGPPDGCPGTNSCINPSTDPANCGGCGIFCAIGEACSSGTCCPTGTVSCGGTCVDVNSDEANCGSCGNSCGTGSVCSGGTCECPFGQVKCGNNCVTPSVDVLNCGTCGNVCGVGQNVGKPFCVSNGCTATCPAPLTPCGTGPNAKCVNLQSDSNNCNGCNNSCGVGRGCSAGQCVDLFPLTNPDLPKCQGGGPPISVPTGGGGSTCTGNLGATSFTFGLCSRTNVGPLSQALFTDAFNSLEGPYKSSCSPTVANDCGPTGSCIGDPANGIPYTCAGGGVGINGTASPVGNNTATTHVGGAFWVFGTIGLEIKTDTVVKQRFYHQGPLKYTKNNRVFDKAFINGGFNTQGQANLRIDDTLYTAATPCDANTGPLGTNVLQLNGSPKCVQQSWDSTLLPPCGTANDLVPVRSIVEHFRNPANNDNAAVGLSYDALASPSSRTRLELPCGYYYLDSLGGNQQVTIVVKGRTAIFVGGAANINTNMIFDVEPTASLDMFIGGVVRIAQPITLGSPAYPRLTRMYIGSSSVGGGGTTCSSNADCGSGLCSACPSAPFAPCSGSGTCTGGSNLSKSIQMSQGGFFNGLLWAGYGEFASSNPVEMYGSIFANYIDFSGNLKVHYDNAAVKTGDECPPLPGGGSCESCRDCGNQACVNNSCGSCTADSQCCPPLRCDNGTCRL